MLIQSEDIENQKDYAEFSDLKFENKKPELSYQFGLWLMCGFVDFAMFCCFGENTIFTML